MSNFLLLCCVFCRLTKITKEHVFIEIYKSSYIVPQNGTSGLEMTLSDKRLGREYVNTNSSKLKKQFFIQ